MSEESAQQGEIDWASAQVEDAVLTVPLAGEPSKAWAGRLEQVVARLAEHGGGPWESVEVTRKQVTVTGVQAGTEGDVHHVLDAAVTQTNADFAPEPGDESDEPGDRADREMADAFRSFAEEPSD